MHSSPSAHSHSSVEHKPVVVDVMVVVVTVSVVDVPVDVEDELSVVGVDVDVVRVVSVTVVVVAVHLTFGCSYSSLPFHCFFIAFSLRFLCAFCARSTARYQTLTVEDLILLWQKGKEMHGVGEKDTSVAIFTLLCRYGHESGFPFLSGS